MDEIQETHLICILLRVTCALQDFLLIHQGSCQVCSSVGGEKPQTQNHNAHTQDTKTEVHSWSFIEFHV